MHFDELIETCCSLLPETPNFHCRTLPVLMASHDTATKVDDRFHLCNVRPNRFSIGTEWLLLPLLNPGPVPSGLGPRRPQRRPAFLLAYAAYALE